MPKPKEVEHTPCGKFIINILMEIPIFLDDLQLELQSVHHFIINILMEIPIFLDGLQTVQHGLT